MARMLCGMGPEVRLPAIQSCVLPHLRPSFEHVAAASTLPPSTHVVCLTFKFGHQPSNPAAFDTLELGAAALHARACTHHPQHAVSIHPPTHTTTPPHTQTHTHTPSCAAASLLELTLLDKAHIVHLTRSRFSCSHTHASTRQSQSLAALELSLLDKARADGIETSKTRLASLIQSRTELDEKLMAEVAALATEVGGRTARTYDVRTARTYDMRAARTYDMRTARTYDMRAARTYDMRTHGGQACTCVYTCGPAASEKVAVSAPDFTVLIPQSGSLNARPRLLCVFYLY
eukprot:180525-Chlamydomonas_euryale.AAC.14